MENLISKIPTELTDEIINFCNDICLNSNPVFVDIKNFGNFELLDCFENINNYIKKNDGDKQYGWSIYEIPKKMIEAEFHCVYKNNGQLIDITPNLLSEKKILFLPDNKTIYEGCQINNYRKNISNDKTIDQLINICDTIFEAENQGELKHSKQVPLTPALNFLYQQKLNIINKLKNNN